MTRENTKKLIPIIKAYAEGKMIQYFNCYNIWVDGVDLNFNDDPSRYRIKPEAKLVPFTFEDKKDIFGKVVRRKEGTRISIINSMSDQFVYVNEIAFKYEQFLEKFEFEDGSPCGKYVEE